MTKIKICGLRRPEDIAYVNEAKPDYAGFIIDVPKSRRNVPREKVRELTALLSPEILPVGVFVNAPMETILSLVTDGTLKAVLIRAFSIRSPEDLTEAEKSPADFVLLDNGAGGTGETFDWSLLSSFDRPFFLAGGLRLENITEAVSRFHPYALDLSSGVETDGYKDKEKIIAAVAAVRR